MSHQFCTFHVNDLFLGVEVEKVQEVLRDWDITPVPTAPPSIRGLINLRGQIVTAVDLRTRFGITEATEEAPSILVLDTGAQPLSLVVDRTGDVVEVDEDNFEEPPDTLQGNARRLIRGAYKMQKTLLLALDIEHALDVDAAATGEHS